MPTRSLPPRPDLAHLKLQAKELQRAHRQGNVAAAARIAGHHPRWKGRRVNSVLAERFTLAEAQLVIAREYGLPSWSALKHRVEIGTRFEKFKPHPLFDEAVAALNGGDPERLRDLIAADPRLVHARTNLEPPYGYFSGATLLHHVAGNPGWGRPMPQNIVAIARLLLELGSDANAQTLGRNGGTTMGLSIDLHEAVCFDLREHVEARLREEPSSINRRIDHWDIPQSTPLHWASWTRLEDVDGMHSIDEARRIELVQLLLRREADVNIVAGNGCTALDIAEAAKALNIAELLRRHGGKRAAEL